MLGDFLSAALAYAPPIKNSYPVETEIDL